MWLILDYLKYIMAGQTRQRPRPHIYNTSSQHDDRSPGAVRCKTLQATTPGLGAANQGE